MNVDISTLTFEEALAALKRALHNRYPNSGMVYFAYSIDAKNRISTFGHFGDKRECELAGTDIAIRDKIAGDFVDDVFLNRVMSIKSGACIKYRSLKMLHDYAVDYARDLGIDTTGIGYFCNRDQKDPEERKDVLNDTESIAARIKVLDDEKKSLLRNLDPNVKYATIKALAKRMRRAGDIVGANAKDKEAEGILERQKRKEQARLKSIENLKLARAAKARKKANSRQAEIDRKKAAMFDPHAAAKAKRKKIRERQAERAATKKKGSENREWVNRPISQVIAARV